jgi:hypothetical protein
MESFIVASLTAVGLPTNTANQLLQLFDSIGCDSASDIRHVTVNELGTVLKLIQARKLVEFWNRNENISTSVHTDSTVNSLLAEQIPSDAGPSDTPCPSDAASSTTHSVPQTAGSTIPSVPETPLSSNSTSLTTAKRSLTLVAARCFPVPYQLPTVHIERSIVNAMDGSLPLKTGQKTSLFKAIYNDVTMKYNIW